MIYSPSDHDDASSLRIYRGMTLHQWSTRRGIARKGSEREAQLYAGETEVGAGDADVYVTGCVQNALTFTAMDSSANKLSWLSFSRDMTVATFFALNQLDKYDSEGGVVIEASLAHLRGLGIACAPNDLRFPWEQEVSVDLFDHASFPESAIVKVHSVRYSELWRSAFKLQSQWGGSAKYTRHAYP